MIEVDRRSQILAELTGPDGAFPIGTARVRGAGQRVYLTAPSSLRDVFATGAQWGDRAAITYEDEHCTWAEFTNRYHRFAGALVERFGVRPGDRVAIALRNYPEWIIAFAAAASVGAVVVPLNAWWSGPELTAALADCTACVLVADRERTASVHEHRAALPALGVVVEVRPGATVNGDLEWGAVLAAQADEFDIRSIPIQPDDDVTILYTSGTTGRPKGAVSSNRAHLNAMLNMRVHGLAEAQLARERGAATGPAPDRPTTLVPGPLFHVSYLPRVLAGAVTGLHLVLMYRWDAARAVDLIEREHVDTLTGVPTVVRQLMDEIERRGTVPPSLRTVNTGGAQSTAALIARITSVFGPRVGTGTGYGLTETNGPMVMIGSHDYIRRPLSVGRALPTSEIRVVGADGRDVATGEIGEAWFRGPNVARGYWGVDTGAFQTDGWFRSGDLVTRDADGFVHIVDRIKDIVIRAGENVYCSEVEEALSDHPAVEDAAVLGVPHDLWGEEVATVVQIRPGLTVTADELRTHAARRLAGFKIPTRIVIGRDPLPRNAAGKVLKRELRDHIGRTLAPTERSH